MFRHPDFTLYALNMKSIAEHKSVHRGKKEVKGRLKKHVLHHKTLRQQRHHVQLLLRGMSEDVLKCSKARKNSTPPPKTLKHKLKKTNDMKGQ